MLRYTKHIPLHTTTSTRPIFPSLRGEVIHTTTLTGWSRINTVLFISLLQPVIGLAYAGSSAITQLRPVWSERTGEEALKAAFAPLIANEDGHFVATVSAFLLSLREGKGDCPIRGVFGAGKTRAAAATVAFPPSKKGTYLLQSNHIQNKFRLPSINFRGICVCFRGVIQDETK